jgi:hypothetical protein
MEIVPKCLVLIVILFAASATLTAGTIVSIDPDNAQLGQSIGVAVVGSGTHFEQGGGTLIWLSQGSYNIYAYGYYPYDDTSLIVWFDIPNDAETGLYDLKVYNNIDGTLTLHNGFVVTPLHIVSVSPNNAQKGQHLSVTITGQNTHFHQGTSTQQGTPTNVWFSRGSQTIYARGSWGISDTLLIAEFDIPCDAATGLHDVGVYSYLDGTLTLDDSFTITPYTPVVTSITPRGAYQGQKLSVTITGQNTHFKSGTPTGYCFAQGTPTFFQGTPTTRNIIWFSQGSSTIFSGDCWARENTLLTANIDIPADAGTGFWDVYIPTGADGMLTLTNGFMVVQPGDWTGDGVVNFFDFAVLADNWLEGTDK